ncbi:unnamed protein product [Staurois parvus]|uniref:Uncharacterized protein n=1 Tax=Staurois parvus TaxID=386267 RepID=A0ABN9AY65_9NEOB|nr:unnamed protein product [Staurois parvus]
MNITGDNTATIQFNTRGLGRPDPGSLQSKRSVYVYIFSRSFPLQLTQTPLS